MAGDQILRSTCILQAWHALALFDQPIRGIQEVSLID